MFYENCEAVFGQKRKPKTKNTRRGEEERGGCDVKEIGREEEMSRFPYIQGLGGGNEP